jgi:hypothetical protein
MASRPGKALGRRSGDQESDRRDAMKSGSWHRVGPFSRRNARSISEWGNGGKAPEQADAAGVPFDVRTQPLAACEVGDSARVFGDAPGRMLSGKERCCDDRQIRCRRDLAVWKFYIDLKNAPPRQARRIPPTRGVRRAVISAAIGPECAKIGYAGSQLFISNDRLFHLAPSLSRINASGTARRTDHRRSVVVVVVGAAHPTA